MTRFHFVFEDEKIRQDSVEASGWSLRKGLILGPN